MSRIGGLIVLTLSLTVDAISKKRLWGAIGTSIGASGKPVTFIPRTDVPMPLDYEDYTRGHPPLALFPSNSSIPGDRSKAPCPGEGLPCFDPAEPEQSAEVWTYGNARDKIQVKCSGEAKGGVAHVFYNVWVPELVPFVVPPGTPGRKDSAVVIAPGGGFTYLTWEPEGISPAEWLNSLGISAFVLKYRVPNRGVADIDAQRAVSLVRSKASEYKINASSIGFLGSSAGGQLAITSAIQRSRSYPAVDAVDEVSFWPDFLLLAYPVIPAINDRRSVSLMPPTFIAFSEDDPCNPAEKSHAFVESVQLNAGAPIAEYAFPDGMHAWGDPDYSPWVKGLSPAQWRSLAESWMQGLHLL